MACIWPSRPSRRTPRRTSPPPAVSRPRRAPARTAAHEEGGSIFSVPFRRTPTASVDWLDRIGGRRQKKEVRRSLYFRSASAAFRRRLRSPRRRKKNSRSKSRYSTCAAPLALLPARTHSLATNSRTTSSESAAPAIDLLHSSNCVVMAHIVMTYIVMADIVMAYIG